MKTPNLYSERYLKTGKFRCGVGIFNPRTLYGGTKIACLWLNRKWLAEAATLVPTGTTECCATLYYRAFATQRARIAYLHEFVLCRLGWLRCACGGARGGFRLRFRLRFCLLFLWVYNGDAAV